MTVTFDTSEIESTEYFRESLGIALRIAPLSSFSVMSLSQRKAPLLLNRVDHVGAAWHEHGASSASDVVDRGLNRVGIVGAPVALGALVLDVDDERRSWRRDASLRRGVLRVGRERHEARRQDEGASGGIPTT